MDKQEIIESIVYDTVLKAIRAQLEVDAAQTALDGATVIRDQSDLAAILIADRCGVDIASVRERIGKEAAI